MNLTSFILAFAMFLPAATQQSLSNGSVAIVDIRGGSEQPDQTISTTIEDANHPGEPWVVTTYRRKDESFESFVSRHKVLVEAVRKALS